MLGTPGKDCQEVYQPAAAAEARFRQQVASSKPSSASQPVPSESTSPAQVALSGSQSTHVAEGHLPASLPVAPQPQAQADEHQAASGTSGATKDEEVVRGAEALSAEAKQWLRDQLYAELQARNKEFSDGMQGLE